MPKRHWEDEMRKTCFLGILSFLVGLVFGCAPANQAQHAEHSHHHDHSHQNSSVGEIEKITMDQLLAKMQRGESVVFLDSRNNAAWTQAESKIPDSIRVGNNEQLTEIIKELPRDQFIVTYCT